MGILRILLALAVVATHAGPWFGLRFFDGGVMAVECFYLLSGFYMALILERRYRDRPGTFYFNRFLRLYPMYWMLAGAGVAASLAYWAVTGRLLGAVAAWAGEDQPFHLLWAGFSNLTMLGSDWAELVRRLHPEYDVNRLIVIQPVWSIAVEIAFYLFAPWLLRLGKPLQVACFAAALLLRTFIWSANGNQWNVWLYYFAPATWVFFLGGVLAHHLYQALQTRTWFTLHARWIGISATCLLGVLIAGYHQLGFLRVQDWKFYTLFGLALPFVFFAFQRSKADAAIAAWSYPLYLSHALVLSLYAPLRHFVPDSLKIHLVLILSLGLSALVLWWDHKIQNRYKLTA